MKIKLLSYFVIFVMSVSNASAASTVHPSVSNFDPLNMPVRMAIPNEATTTWEAVMYVLEPTGYKLILTHDNDNVRDVLTDPIVPEAFSGKVMTIADALLMLIRKENKLVIDPSHHLVTFERLDMKKTKE